ncbi:hypothetical protein PoB_002383900 [Plakobranchus ocellatus]|uniref:Uncharacterized protein n=1 Tax=Plakobranchus ocellatus TaxID=259542 RepID=A0AAV3ZPT7_9GAST|nr:hypothetical protein PoB_002383900 [Plakobranchus ocellatus]
MEDPLAACKFDPMAPDTLSAHEAGVTETWAPVTTMKRLITNSCVIFYSDIADVDLIAAKHSGSADGLSSAGPLSRFPSFLLNVCKCLQGLVHRLAFDPNLRWNQQIVPLCFVAWLLFPLRITRKHN